MDVAIGGETTVTVDNKPLSALSDAVCAPCHQAAVRGNDAASASLFIKALKKTSHLHENSGTVEYFAGQYIFRLTGPPGKWLKKLSLSPVTSWQ